MANIIYAEVDNQIILNLLIRTFQSGNINFLIGSGASSPTIPIGGDIELEIYNLLEENKDDEANIKFYELLRSVQDPCNLLIEDTVSLVKKVCEKEKEDSHTCLKCTCKKTLLKYHDLLENVEGILLNRKTNLLPRKVNIFSTNYDLFIEKASETL